MLQRQWARPYNLRGPLSSTDIQHVRAVVTSFGEYGPLDSQETGENTSCSAESLECSTSRSIASRCVGSEIGSRSEEKLIEDREELYT